MELSSLPVICHHSHHLGRNLTAPLPLTYSRSCCCHRWYGWKGAFDTVWILLVSLAEVLWFQLRTQPSSFTSLSTTVCAQCNVSSQSIFIRFFMGNGTFYSICLLIKHHIECGPIVFWSWNRDLVVLTPLASPYGVFMCYATWRNVW